MKIQLTKGNIKTTEEPASKECLLVYSKLTTDKITETISLDTALAIDIHKNKLIGIEMIIEKNMEESIQINFKKGDLTEISIDEQIERINYFFNTSTNAHIVATTKADLTDNKTVEVPLNEYLSILVHNKKLIGTAYYEIPKEEIPLGWYVYTATKKGITRKT